MSGKLDDNYVTMFEQFDAISGELGIDSYAVSVTSLEDVFIRFVRISTAAIVMRRKNSS